MKFIDRAVITVRSGKGGDGAVSFARSRFNPRGGPDGADGGKGGDVIFKAVGNKSTLIDFEYKREYFAQDGIDGAGVFKKGKDAKALYITVPAGVIIYDNKTKEKIAELVNEGQEVVIARGGRGGLGNSNFKSARKRTPLEATKGEKGVLLELLIELKLLADVSLVGFPNAGKSTIISRLSRAKPKIADYPFTTLTPNIGVLKLEDKNFVIADIPGLVEGASKGVGLGLSFLRHIERSRLIAHVVDLTENDILDRIATINKELKEYSKDLLKKEQIFVFNKLDVSNNLADLDKLQRELIAIDIDSVKISAVRGDGLKELSYLMATKLEKQNKFKRLLIFGGSFDPLHDGHIEIVNLVSKLPNSKLMVMPCYQQALKDRHKFSATERLECLKKEFKGKAVLVSEYEVLQRKKTYSIDTIKFLNIFYPAQHKYLVLGLDSFCELDKWKNFEELLSYVNLIVFNRGGSNFSACLENLGTKLGYRKFLERKLNKDFCDKTGIRVYKVNGNYIYFVEDFDFKVSSTQLRKNV